MISNARNKLNLFQFNSENLSQHYEEVGGGHDSIVSVGNGVTAVYVTSDNNADTSAVAADFSYTAGDKLRIPVSKYV